MRPASASLLVLSALAPFTLALAACGSDGGAPAAYFPEEEPATPSPSEGDLETNDGGSLLGACAEGSVTVKREAANVLFLVDRSGSMHIKLPSGDTRWQATKKGLFDLLGALPASTTAGAMMFPQGDAPVNAYCGIDATLNDVKCTSGWPVPSETARCSEQTYAAGVLPAKLTSAQVSSIQNYVSTSDSEFYWGTPLAPALGAAVTAQKAATGGARSVILLTDGNPTSCGESGIDNSISHVIAAAQEGTEGTLVRTFVIGVIDNAVQAAKAENLSPVAVAGGTGRYAGCEATNDCFYPVTANNFAGDIKKVFEDISLQAFDCTFSIPEPAKGQTMDPDTVNVEVSTPNGGYVISRDPGRKDGWDYLPGQKQIQVYGEACKKLAEDGSSVKIVVGCETRVK